MPNPVPFSRSPQAAGKVGAGRVDPAKIDAEPSGPFDKAKELYGWYQNYEKIQALIDPDTRSGQILEEAFDRALELASKLLGEGIENHPYAAYHKAHIKVLAEALNAMSKKERIDESWNQAVETAKFIRKTGDDHIKATPVSRENPDLRDLDVLMWQMQIMQSSMEAQRRFPHSPKEDAEIESTMKGMRLRMGILLWNVKQQASGSLSLWMMMREEVHVLEGFQNPALRMTEEMKSGGGFQTVFGYAAQKRQQFGFADGMDNPIKEAENAVGRIKEHARKWAIVMDKIAIGKRLF
jgi:hypothetical protein